MLCVETDWRTSGFPQTRDGGRLDVERASVVNKEVKAGSVVVSSDLAS